MNTHERQSPAETLNAEIRRAAQRLRQFGRLAASRLFGTLPNTSGRYKAVVDEWERSLFTRAELSGLARLMIEKGVFTRAEWAATTIEEYRALADACEKSWPELRVDELGIHVHDLAAFTARSKSEGWPE
jgi:hypothetical protein